MVIEAAGAQRKKQHPCCTRVLSDAQYKASDLTVY